LLESFNGSNQTPIEEDKECDNDFSRKIRKVTVDVKPIGQAAKANG